MFSRISRDRERREHLRFSHLVTYLQSRRIRHYTMFRRLHNYFAGHALARTEKFPRAREGERRTRTEVDVEEVRWWFSGERNQAICRHAGVVRIDKTTAREAYPGEMCVRYVKMERGAAALSQTRSNNTTATIGRILMTFPALARDNRNGFIRFTYTPRDLSAFRPSRRYLALYRGYKEHLLSFVIIIPIR